jgi:hypothetical protein
MAYRQQQQQTEPYEQQQQQGAAAPAEAPGVAAAAVALGMAISPEQQQAGLQARLPAGMDEPLPQQLVRDGSGVPIRGLSGEHLLLPAGALSLQDSKNPEQHHLQQHKVSSGGALEEQHQQQEQQKGSIGGAEPQLQQQQDSTGRVSSCGVGDQGTSPSQCWGRPLATVVPHSPTVRHLTEQQQQQVSLPSTSASSLPPPLQQQQQDLSSRQAAVQDRSAASRRSAPGTSPRCQQASNSSSEPVEMRRSLPGAKPQLLCPAGGSGAAAAAVGATVAIGRTAHGELSASPLAPPGVGVPGLEPALATHEERTQQQEAAGAAVGVAVSPSPAAAPGPGVLLLPGPSAAEPWDPTWAAAVPANKRVKLSSLQFGHQVGEGGFGKVGGTCGRLCPS